MENIEQYQAVVDDAVAIIVETGFASRIETIRGKWLLGQVVNAHCEYVGAEKGGRGIESFATRFAKSLGEQGQRISSREVRRCIQFYQKYPELGLSPEQGMAETEERLFQLPGGKALSWKMIAKDLLPDPPAVRMPTKALRVLAYSQERIGQTWTKEDHSNLERMVNRGTKDQAA